MEPLLGKEQYFDLIASNFNCSNEIIAINNRLKDYLTTKNFIDLDLIIMHIVKEGLWKNTSEEMKTKYYWDAFWDAITGLVRMPKTLIFVGWSNLGNKIPKDSVLLKHLLAEQNNQFPGSGCDVYY